MRYDSCRQCTKRRIICDKATPQCSKCVKKGLDCSGIGKKYRFVEQSTSCVLKKYASGKVGVKEVRRQSDRDAPKNSSSTAVVSTNQLTGVDVTSVAVDYEIDVEGTAASSSCLGPSISKLRPQQQQQQQLMPFSVVVAQQSDFPLSYTLETIKPEQMMLFDHCKHHTMITSSNVLTRIFVNQGPSVVAKVIAPYMVVYDTDNNGYRNLILPLAHHDSLVQRAVSVVSALHLSIQQPELRHNAEMGRTAILTRLRQDAMSGSSRNVSTLSTWATIIILLVGETVTGSPDFVHLFSMLRDLALLQHGNSLGSRSMSTFLDLQRRMYVNLVTSRRVSRGVVEGGKSLCRHFSSVIHPLIPVHPTGSNSIRRHCLVHLIPPNPGEARQTVSSTSSPYHPQPSASTTTPSPP
jgi:hypothetical protein